jgi:eukaryotic-like serine/threonine-protein kinase
MRLMRDLIGETLSNRYMLRARVAGGGMGEVYRAHDVLLDRTVAVKILQPSLAIDPDLVARFKAEAQAAARLTHPNVVSVHDWGSEDESTYYMVMEYVAGTDLRDLLCAHGSLRPAQGAEMIAHVCHALDAAHRGGLVHRDIKPENILIAKDGTVKVADFGIAVVADVDRTSPGGAIPGTLRYLSPEQAAGREATPASDIWAAGAVLSEALTGRPPLLGSGSDLLRRRAIETPIPPSMFAEDVPRELDAVVMRACAVEPRDRYTSAMEMAADLRRVSARSVTDAPSIGSLLIDLTGEVDIPGAQPTTMMSRKQARRSRRRRRVARVGLMLILILLLAFGGYRAGAALFGPQEIRVPSLIGLQSGQAESRAKGLGLIVEISDRTKHTRAPAGQVLGQVPSGGVVEEGATITLYLSAGLPSHRVPSVVAFDFVKAESMLEASGLRLGKVARRFSGKPKGTVVAQRPDGGRLEWGSEVNLVVSKGPRPVEITNVVGLQLDEAQGELEELGLFVTVKEVFDEKVDADKVIMTNPQPGQTVAKGSEVLLTVSKGPKLKTMRMPDVRGKSVKVATAQLEKIGLVVEVQDACGGGNIVAETDPQAGVKVTERDTVALFVC